MSSKTSTELLEKLVPTTGSSWDNERRTVEEESTFQTEEVETTAIEGGGGEGEPDVEGVCKNKRPSFIFVSGFLILFTLASISMMIYVDSLKCHHVTELEKAVNKGDLQKVEKSLKESNIDEENCDGDTPLLLATRLNNANITKLLLDRGASPSKKGQFGHTALIISAINGNTDIVEAILHANEPAVNIQDDIGETALHHAAWEGEVETVKLLLEAGADPNIRERFGEIPLVKATFRCYAEIVALLLQYGSDVNALDLTGEAPLHNAAAANCVPVAKLLLDNGACPGITDVGDVSALDIAEQYKHSDIVQLIENYIDTNLASGHVLSAADCYQ